MILGKIEIERIQLNYSAAYIFRSTELLEFNTSFIVTFHRINVVCHVLIIENEPFFVMDIQELLGSVGATSFDFVDTQIDAVAAATARRPAIITSDVALFEGTGPAAVEQIRVLMGYIPVIFITATPQDCARLIGDDAVLSKPLDHGALRAQFAARR